MTGTSRPPDEPAAPGGGAAERLRQTLAARGMDPSEVDERVAGKTMGDEDGEHEPTGPDAGEATRGEQ